ncbi:MAG: hypothetical protein MR796_01965, partial [Veillonella caviae]|nr:hypothetical protein [Veillonella caviae]
MDIRNQLAAIACVSILILGAGCSSNQLPNMDTNSSSQSVKVSTGEETTKTTSKAIKMVYFIPTEDGKGVKQVSVETTDAVTPKAALLAMLK